MPKLFIHMGFHNTGCSILYKTLQKNKGAIRNCSGDVDFVSNTKSGNSSSFIQVSKGIQPGDFEYKVKPSFYSFLKEKAINEKDLIISLEHLSFLNTEEEIKALKSKLAALFDDIIVVSYIDRQDKLARLFKVQSSKVIRPGHMPSSLIFGHKEGVFPQKNKTINDYFSFYKKLMIWKKYFGSNLIVKNSDKELLKHSDVVTDFLYAIDCSLDFKNEFSNSMPDRDNFVYSNKILDLGFSQSFLKLFRKLTPVTNKMPFPSRSEALQFYSDFSKDNEGLVKEFSQNGFITFNSDFDEYPEINNTKLTMSDYEAILSITNKALKLDAYNIDKIRSKDIDFRVQYYFGEVKPLSDDFLNSLESSHYQVDKPILYWFEAYKNGTKLGGTYRKDMDSLLQKANKKSLKLPVLFGDKTLNKPLPVFVKARNVDDKNGILLKLNSGRHWKREFFKNDIPWEKKKLSLVWRGAPTGFNKLNSTDRYKFVKNYFEQYDIGFALNKPNSNIDSSLIKGKLTISEQLQYKLVVSIEGNDVATNLKWILASNSIPIMKRPTKESWLMEGLLRPYYHYLPLNNEMDNIDEIISWVFNHPNKAKEISMNGKVFMQKFLDEGTEDLIQLELLKMHQKLLVN